MTKKKLLPMRFREDAWKELSSDQKRKISQIAVYDLSFLEGEPLYRQGIARNYLHKDAIEELRKFLTIKIIVDPKYMGMFGPVVVAAWHAFILHTVNYEKFCKKFYRKIIHLVPGHKRENDTTIWLGIYHSWYGNLPPVWKVDINGMEIPGMEEKMNLQLCCDEDHLDSDDSAYE